MHAYGVCDDEEYFYNFIDGIFADLGATPDVLGPPFAHWSRTQHPCLVNGSMDVSLTKPHMFAAGKTSRDLLIAHQAKGAGYAISRPDELQSILAVSESTGQHHGSVQQLTNFAF